MWDENVIEIDAERPQEKKAGDQEKGNCVAAVGERRGGRLRHLFFLRSSVGAIEVDVAAVDEKMLAGDVRGLTGNQEENLRGNLVGARHAAFQRNLGNDGSELLLLVGKG